MDISLFNKKDLITLKQGDILYKQNEECNTMFILLEGCIELYINYGEKNQFCFYTLSEPGASLGEMGLLEGENRNGTAVCKSDSILVELTYDNFESFLALHSSIGVKMISDLAHRFKIVTSEVKDCKEVIEELSKNQKVPLKSKLKRLVEIFTTVPDEIPADLYMNCYTRNHTNLR